MIKWGINCLNHNASISVIDTENNKILFASESERFSKIKNDKFISDKLLEYALRYGEPQKIIISESPFRKKIREIKSQQWDKVFEKSSKRYIQELLKKYKINPKYSHCSHHLSHARHGYFTSKFDDAGILVIDAIGDNECISIWKARKNKLKCLHKIYYPHSLGLLYSSFTQHIGKKPNEEEYIVMGMSAYGQNAYYDDIQDIFIKNQCPLNFKLNYNLHKGLPEHKKNIFEEKFNSANSIQTIYEYYLELFCDLTKQLSKSENLIIVGGCALNCVANTKMLNTKIFKNMYIPFNCGDGGLSMGCILNEKVKQNVTYLGYEIEKNHNTINDIINELLKGNVVGLANGKAEFGPRALGNRSLLADPRTPNVKDLMNKIKNREDFRPFAASIMEEFVDDYFLNSYNSSHMQYVFEVLEPEKYKGICHIDNTCRIQTVNENQNLFYYLLLDKWYEKTGCPMLLNTSLNIKGQPIINDENDIIEFEKKYNIPIYS